MRAHQSLAGEVAQLNEIIRASGLYTFEIPEIHSSLKSDI